MRALFALFLLPLAPVTLANAQDPTMIAVQQTQIANQQAQQAAQQANTNAQNAAAASTGGVPMSATPKFSVKPGTYPRSITVTLKCGRGAYLYYTTDGWTPTIQSTPYTGPITISSTTRLQAIAITDGFLRSQIASADYVISGASYAPAAPAPGGSPQAQLVFTASVRTEDVQVGDKLPVVLAQDLRLNDAIVAPKGTAVLATVTHVDRPGFVGSPGTISFAVHSINVKGKLIRLSATETKEGQSKLAKTQHMLMIPGAGAVGLLLHGQDAVIDRGATLNAAVEASPVSSASIARP